MRPYLITAAGKTQGCKFHKYEGDSIYSFYGLKARHSEASVATLAGGDGRLRPSPFRENPPAGGHFPLRNLIWPLGKTDCTLKGRPHASDVGHP